MTLLIFLAMAGVAGILDVFMFRGAIGVKLSTMLRQYNLAR